MNWKEELILQLVGQPIGGYADDRIPASEPTALSAMALAAADKLTPAEQGMDFLAGMQQADGSVGVREGEPTPAWTTSLATLAWMAHPDAESRYGQNIAAAIEWTLQTSGVPIPRENAIALGHDTTLVGWSWAENTHSWMEPTILHLLSLKAYGQSDHPRSREAVRMLIDRQLPGGGCNYGNTFVLGQALRPHLQPSGMLLLALADEEDSSGRKAKSIQYVAQAVSSTTTTASLCWALLGLAAVGKTPAESDAWLENCFRRLYRSTSLYRLALLANATLADRSPLVRLVTQGVAG